jgi:hypothetical protein
VSRQDLALLNLQHGRLVNEYAIYYYKLTGDEELLNGLLLGEQQKYQTMYFRKKHKIPGKKLKTLLTTQA